MIPTNELPSDAPLAISSFALDRMHVGELSAAERVLLQSQIDGSDKAAAQLEQRKEVFASLHTRPDFAALLDREWDRHATLHQERQTKAAPASASPFRTGWREWLTWQGWTSLATAGAMALIFAMLPPGTTPMPSTQQTSPGHSLTRATAPAQRPKSGCKGGCLTSMFRVLYFRKGAPYPKWLRDRQILQSGDLIQFSLLVSQQPTHIMIVGMNQRGERYAFVPYQGKVSLQVKAGTLKLPQSSSLELDDYVGPERFYFFSSHQPFSLQQVKQAMWKAFQRHGGSIDDLERIDGPWKSKSLLIYKRKREIR